MDRHGDYVTCGMGHALCQGGSWGACVSESLVTKSLGRSTLGFGGLHTSSVTVLCPSGSPQCTDACDPNAYTLTNSDAGDIDGSGFETTDGGLSVQPTCVGIGCQVALDCSSTNPTQLTGKVFDPAGHNPVSGALVYIPSGALTAFPEGASCEACPTSDLADAVAVAQSGTDGTFTLQNVPSTDVAPGNSIPLVVQTGKWRREVMLSSVRKCVSNQVDPASSRLPRNKLDGNGNQADLPRIAVAAGKFDELQCLLLKMGVDSAEFQPSAGPGMRRIDYYDANGMPLPGATAESTLVDNAMTLGQYDLVLLGCNGGDEATPAASYAGNVASYAGAGGRVITTHRGSAWLTTPMGATPNPFFGVASWNLGSGNAAGSVDSLVDTTGPGGVGLPSGSALSSWLFGINASSAMGHVSINQPFSDIFHANAPAFSLIHENAPGATPFYLSFGAPLGGIGGVDGGAEGGGSAEAGADGGAEAGSDGGSGGTCGRVDFADFHVLTADVPDTTGCKGNADCGFGSTCTLPPAMGTCQPLGCDPSGDCNGTGYSCVGGTPGSCIAETCQNNDECGSLLCNTVTGQCVCKVADDCASGFCNTTTGLCAPSANPCKLDAECGGTEQCSGGTPGACQKGCKTDGDCNAGELCSGGQCQGCWGGPNCPSGSCNIATPSTCTMSSNQFPLGCRQEPMTPQEDTLEFMILDATSCPQVAQRSGALGIYPSATFTEDFTSSCAPGTRVIWRELDWQAIVPPTASIAFTAQTVESPDDGGTPDYSSVSPIPLATATTSTTLPGFDVALLDTGTTGAFNLASPPVMSRNDLRLTVTLNPTSSLTAAPTLIQWVIKADCLPAE